MKKLWERFKSDAIAYIIIAIFIFIACGCAGAAGYALISSQDFKAATAADYVYLEEQIDIINNQGLEAVYDIEDITVTIKENTVKLESEECSISLEVDDKRNFIETARDDKAIQGWEMVLNLFNDACCIIFTGSIILWIEVELACLVETCFEKVKMLKNRKRKP